jgi:hypothetical protein
MRAISFGALVLWAFVASQAHATTYDYTGLSLTETPSSYVSGCSPSCTNSGLTGSVEFAMDTSQFTGTLTFSSVVTAELSGSIRGTNFDATGVGFDQISIRSRSLGVRNEPARLLS